ncbi:MAG: helix-turn-helix transcriptional regulator [Spirochaeta sp.]|jgi:HTH-type transcriptional regulator/antitoxin HipB|nr:helix-turn-helix transcriptional regulator [Spirochaeta sp.]
MDFPVRTVDQLEPILRSFRKTRGLTQLELAGQMGVTQQALSLLETAPHRASFERLLAVCAALDVEIVFRDRRLQQVAANGGW